MGKLLDLISQGNFKTVAARACGITSETLSQWEKHKPGFSEAIRVAEAEAEAGNVKNIYNASQSQWTASAWFLERKSPERWGKKEEHKISGHLLNGSPDDIEKAVIEMYKENPEIWERVKQEVEG